MNKNELKSTAKIYLLSSYLFVTMVAVKPRTHKTDLKGKKTVIRLNIITNFCYI